MLKNGLGDLLEREVRGASRFVDLFTGSSAVSAHIATKYNVPVTAYDLQTFSTVLARSILGRDSRVNAKRLWKIWYEQAKTLRALLRPPSARAIDVATVKRHRQWCSRQEGPFTRAYGGYYFSALQAVWLDALRKTLPEQEPGTTVALAALVTAASKCAAAPGHTAQPFQPTRTAKPFLIEAWQTNILECCEIALSEISEQYAKVIGHAEVADANDAVSAVAPADLVFVDPPYSGVHYSRFYHVLESVARGQLSEVSGTGRYPDFQERPRSRYSLKSESATALGTLFETISARGAKAIVTFPQRRCSNGLSGRIVLELAGKHFRTEQHWVASKFSTLGGNNEHRDARRATRELILVLRAQ